MYPVLFSFGNLTISSFGLCLILGLLVASFYIWRIIRLYDFDEERAIDLILWVSVFTLIFSRVYFIGQNPTQFTDFWRMVLLNKYSGLSFWGAVIGAFLTLRFFAFRYRVNFWMVADYATIGGLIVIAFGSIGCLLGSCSYGLPTEGFWGVPQVGIVGKRFPIQIIDFLLTVIVFSYLFKKILRFHFNGQIFALGLIFVGFMRLLTQPFRGFAESLFMGISDGYIWSTILIIYGILVYYRQSKRSMTGDLSFVAKIFTRSSTREQFISRVGRWWRNLTISLSITLAKYRRILVKYLNVKSNPREF